MCLVVTCGGGLYGEVVEGEAQFLAGRRVDEPRRRLGATAAWLSDRAGDVTTSRRTASNSTTRQFTGHHCTTVTIIIIIIIIIVSLLVKSHKCHKCQHDKTRS